MIVGTAGHIDHGKTSLVRVLTGVDTDRLKDEKARGISIDLGFAYLPSPDGGVLGFVDVPGHERFVHNMLAGASGIDFVLLVIAADDGVMPQTTEHLAIVDLLGISHGLVAITKADVVDADRLADVRTEIANVLATTALRDVDMIAVSSQTGQGIDDLRQRLFAEAQQLGSRSDRGRFRLAVDRSFTLQGAGTVVTGTVLSGQVQVEDQLRISPSGLTARVRSIHAQNRPAQAGRAGDRCALNLAGDGITKDAIARGQIVLDPALHAPADRIDATLRVLATEPRPVTQWMPVRLSCGGGSRRARGAARRRPHGARHAGVRATRAGAAIAAAAGDRFVLRDTSAQRTIGGGMLLDLRAPARKRHAGAAGAARGARHRRSGQALSALLDRPPGYVDFTAFCRDRALSAPECEALVTEIGLFRLATPKGELAVSPANWLRLKRGMLATLTQFHAENQPAGHGAGAAASAASAAAGAGLRCAAAGASRAPRTCRLTAPGFACRATRCG